jgi:hypothetical protein
MTVQHQFCTVQHQGASRTTNKQANRGTMSVSVSLSI